MICNSVPKAIYNQNQRKSYPERAKDKEHSGCQVEGHATSPVNGLVDQEKQL